MGVGGAFAAGWGVLGHLALLAVAVRQIVPKALVHLTDEPLGPGDWLVASAAVALLGYFMGYRGLHRSYAPLVVARSVHLARNLAAGHAIVAPAYCVGLVHASRGRRIRASVLFATMVLLAVAVGTMPQPYRAIADLGVALGLAWGAFSLISLSLRAILGRPPESPLDLPATEREARPVPRSPRTLADPGADVQ